MRIVRCDNCRQEAEVERWQATPDSDDTAPDWISVEIDQEEAGTFCSFACLAAWANREALDRSQH